MDHSISDPPSPPGPTTGGSYRLRETTSEPGRLYLLDRTTNSLGRGRVNNIVLDQAGVSRRHALIVVKQDEVQVEDLGSKNGIQVNGKYVLSSKLEPGDRLKIGGARFQLETAESDGGLGIHLALPHEPRDEEQESTTHHNNASGFTGVSATILQNFLRRVVAGAGNLHPALQGLLEEFYLEGAVVIEWTHGKPPSIRACAGTVDHLEEMVAVLSAGQKIVGEEPEVQSTGAWRHPLSVVHIRLSEKRRLSLAIWGDAAETTMAPQVLRSLARVLFLLQPQIPVAPPQAASHSRSLVFPPGYIVGTSPASRSLHGQMEIIASYDLPVLLHGETGVGKELAARTLHLSGPRSAGPFVALNCAAIPKDLLEAELFGISKGVATGVDERPGRFAEANGGTIFLDEIAEMPFELQAKLLRVLQEREVQPLGSKRIPLDLQIISAANVDLQERMENKRFRADLYYRIAGMHLEIPPLRKRVEDIPLLVEHFARQLCSNTRKHVRGVTARALDALRAYPWPGNVRQLENEVRKLVILCPDHQPITYDLLPEWLKTRPPELAGQGASGGDPQPADIATWESLEIAPRVEVLERALIREALCRVDGRQAKAARLLGMSRNGLVKKLKRLDLKAGWARREP